jgi:hypothetical protein
MDAHNSATAVTSTSGPDSPPSSSSHIMHHPHHAGSGHPILIPCTTAAPTTAGSNFTDAGLVVPRKLLNPCLESRERIDLHRELRFNVKALVFIPPYSCCCCCCCCCDRLTVTAADGVDRISHLTAEC